MTEFTSEVRKISHADDTIFLVLSDLRKLELIKDKIPQDKIKDFSCDENSVTLSVDPVGTVRFVIVDRQPNSTIKFEAEKVPFPINLWIQLKALSENETALKITVKADLNPFLKPMVSKPLQQGVEKMAEMIANLAYYRLKE